MASNLHVGDVGTAIVITVKNQSSSVVNLSIYNNTTLIFKRPDGTIVQRVCAWLNDGTDGKVQYITTSEDLTMPGNYKFQVRCSTSSNVWHSNIVTQKVYSNVAE